LQVKPIERPPPYGSAAHIFESVREAGENELLRPAQSLWWSGIAAGLAMSTSVIARAMLELHLPDAPWAALISGFGYTAGFLIVVLGRMQLFTENTLTTVLPLLRRRDLHSLGLTARLWALVFLANLVGAAAVSALIVHAPLAGPEQLTAILEVSRHATDGSLSENLRFGIPAGFLIAAVVWLGSASVVHKLWVVLLLTYLIAIADYAHVVAGSVEVFLVVFADGPAELLRLWTFTAPALLGNVLGGTCLFALLAYAQVQLELAPPEEIHERVERSENPDTP
jgi:formate-nitrite transporter family protein